MFYPEYVWMVFSWYLHHWWLAKSSCAKHHIQAKKLERLVRTSLVFDHYPRMEDEDADKLNVGGIVSNYMLIKISI